MFKTGQVHPASFANGRYQVTQFLGEGGKKKVYLAHDTTLDSIRGPVGRLLCAVDITPAQLAATSTANPCFRYCSTLARDHLLVTSVDPASEFLDHLSPLEGLLVRFLSDSPGAMAPELVRLMPIQGLSVDKYLVNQRLHYPRDLFQRDQATPPK